MNWKEYENKVEEYFRTRFPKAIIKRNAKMPGRLSGSNRDIDILIESQIFGHSLQIGIECKNWNSKLDVADVGTFIDKLKDVGISKGVIISKLGYSEHAHQRARGEIGVQLQVLDFENLPSFYGFWAYMYRGYLGAIVSAPNGWVVNSDVPPEWLHDMLCLMHPMEYTAKEAGQKKQLMYFQLFPNLDDNNLKNSFLSQDNRVIENDPKAVIEYWEEVIERGKVRYRKIRYIKDGYTELTAGVETDSFFAYCVYSVPNDYLPDDLARLRYVMEKLRLLKLDGVDPTDSHKSWEKVMGGILKKGT